MVSFLLNTSIQLQKKKKKIMLQKKKKIISNIVQKFAVCDNKANLRLPQYYSGHSLILNIN